MGKGLDRTAACETEVDPLLAGAAGVDVRADNLRDRLLARAGPGRSDSAVLCFQ